MDNISVMLLFEILAQGYSVLCSNKRFLNLNCVGYSVKYLYLKVGSHGGYAWEFLLTLAWTSMKVPVMLSRSI